jgi:hypothetical protein
MFAVLSLSALRLSLELDECGRGARFDQNVVKREEADVTWVGTGRSDMRTSTIYRLALFVRVRRDSRPPTP